MARRKLSKIGLILVVGLLLITGLSPGLNKVIDQAQANADSLRASAAQYDGDIIQVYSARTLGSKGKLAVHTWVATKRKGEAAFLRYEVIGWRMRWADEALAVYQGAADAPWFGNPAHLLLDKRGAGVGELIDKVQRAVADYPYKNQYTIWPGPNSNTFTAYVGLQVPELGLDLPATAIGKDYREFSSLAGFSPSGTGVQLSLWGLAGLAVGYEEGVEINVLGLNFELDLFDLAIELPSVGRIGRSPVGIER